MPTPSPTTEELEKRYGAKYKWLLLATLMIGTMASILSSTIVNVAVPDLSHHFRIGQERAQWVSASFMLSMTLAMLLTPWLLRRFGLRRTYLGTIALLLAGGVVGGFSVNYPMLLTMRVVEGLAAGILQPIPAIVIMRVFDTRERGTAMGYFGFGIILAPAIGPSIGGVLVEHFGWRSIFFVVVPFCLAVLEMGRRWLASSATLARQAEPLDLKGLVLVSVATTLLLNGLVELHGELLQASAMLICSLVFFGAFIGYQLRAQHGLMNMQLFRYRQFSIGALVAFIYGAGLFGSTYLVPIYMQMALHYSPSQAGVLLLLPGFVLAFTMIAAGKLTDRYPAHLLVSFGLALLALSFVLMALNANGYFVLMAWAAVGRLGLGFVLPALTLGAMRGIESGMVPQGVSVINFIRQLGGAIGVSAVGIVLQWRLAMLPPGAPDTERIHAFNETFLLVAALCGIAVLAAWNMRPAARHAA